MWNTARIRDMLSNQVYVRADTDVYDFFKNHEADVINPISGFTGYNACYLYKGWY